MSFSNLGAAPRTRGKLVRRPASARSTADASLSQGLSSFAESIRRSVAPHPKAQAKRSLAPSVGIISSNRFTCAEERRGSLELLESQQSQGVAHKHCNAMISFATFDFPLQ